MKSIQKNFIRVFALLGLTVAFTSLTACHHHGTNEPDTPDSTKTDSVQPVDSFPTHDYPNWVVGDTTDLESTMTITGCLPEALQDDADTTDLVAVFANSQCWGVGHIQMIGDIPYFFLYITRPVSAIYFSSVHLTLRYYCAETRYIYVQRGAIEFVVDKHIGTIEEPFVPTLTEHE